MWSDLRSGLRLLWRHPAFTATSAVVLALGIGINGAIFSIVYTVFFRPLPVTAPEELVYIYQSDKYGRPGISGDWNRRPAEEFLEANPHAAGRAGFWGMGVNIEIDQVSERTRGELVTANYFDVLGVRAELGRTFVPAEGAESNPDVGVVISHDLWQRRFGGGPDAIGQRVLLNKRPVTVVGVADARFKGLVGPWTPSQWWVVGRQFNPRAGLGTFARLKPNARIEQLRATLDVQGRDANERMRQRSPQHALPPGIPYYQVLHAGDVRFPNDPRTEPVPARMAVALTVVVIMVLLIATTNITGLLMARGLSRTNELATRRALGVSTWRLTRQLLTESLLLSIIGGALGAALAYNLVALFMAATPSRFAIDVALDWRLLAFTAVVCLGTGLLVGLAPARQAVRVDVTAALGGGYRESGRGQSRLRHLIVIPQVALSLLLLVVAGVHVRALADIEGQPVGFDIAHTTVLTVERNTSESSRTGPQRPPDEIAQEYQALYRRLYESIRSVTATDVALTSWMLLRAQRDGTDAARSERGHAAGTPENLEVTRAQVSPGYFRVMGITVRRGRDFDDRDTRNARPVIVVSQSVADRLWPGQDPLEQRMATFWPGQSNAKLDWFTVVGVVNDTKAILSDPRDPGHIYVSLGQQWRPWAYYLVTRSGTDMTKTVEHLRSAVAGADTLTAVASVQTMRQMVDEILYPRRLAAGILGVSGLIGLLLASVGLYGVVSFSVARRMRELGIRATLGAKPGDLVGLVLSEGGRVISVGSVIGLALGVVALRLTSHMADGLPRVDWLVFVTVPLMLALVVLAACYLPARRAARVDPMSVLRNS